jgi:hypothetical protein
MIQLWFMEEEDDRRPITGPIIGTCCDVIETGSVGRGCISLLCTLDNSNIQKILECGIVNKRRSSEASHNDSFISEIGKC